ncbi:hypothetical protein CCACVL1_21710 [Corchorus capsularis]|uniref:Uncharacterized protein n=1 Tax=Corchorus capsularis TaxID=210143 RepID=A0A1R3H2B3_COCAP|nr:hypothetical protein CCACVL1_21710 [Corchorus capsularis]
MSKANNTRPIARQIAEGGRVTFGFPAAAQQKSNTEMRPSKSGMTNSRNSDQAHFTRSANQNR